MATKKIAQDELPDVTEAQADLTDAAPVGQAPEDSELDANDGERCTAFQAGDIVTSTGKDRHKVLQVLGHEKRINLQLDVTSEGKPVGGDTKEVDIAGYSLVFRP